MKRMRRTDLAQVKVRLHRAEDIFQEKGRRFNYFPFEKGKERNYEIIVCAEDCMHIGRLAGIGISKHGRRSKDNKRATSSKSTPIAK